MLFIKHSKDKDKLSEILEINKERFREMERRAVDVIQAVTSMDLKYDESEVKVDMCQAIQDMRLEERQLGEKRGKKQGELMKAIKMSKNLYDLGLDIEKIAQSAECPIETVKEWLGIE